MNANILSILSLIISFAALISNIVNIVLTNKRFKRIDDFKEIPKPEIYKIIVPKCIKNAPDSKDRHKRFYYGQTLRDITCEGLIETQKLDDKEVKEFFENKGKIYFTEFQKKFCIMLNFIKDEDYVVVEHQSTVITFVNSGETLKALSVISVEIEYINGGKKVLEGDASDFITFNLEKGGKYNLILNEATNDFQHSICELNTVQYSKYPDGGNLLGMEFNSYFLKYKKLIFRFIETDLRGRKYEIKILLELNNRHFTPTTKIVKKLHGFQLKKKRW